MKRLQSRSHVLHLLSAGIVSLLAAALLLPATTFAASTQPGKCSATNTQCIISAGNASITARLTALSTLNTKVTGDQSNHKITSSQASELQADITTNEHGLSTLKTKLDAETTASSARQDFANIYLQFRIFAVVIPRDYHKLLLDVEINVQQTMSIAAPAIQAAISKAPASQQTNLKALFSDYQLQVSNASSQFTIANQDIPQMTPQAFNQQRTAYTATRKSLNAATSAANKDLHKGADDLHQIVKILGHDI